jgi:hypothetical protein
MVACVYNICTAQNENKKLIEENGMSIRWHYAKERIFFEMSAPTDGWVTIGFNTTSSTEGAYLLMGSVVNGETKLVEHYTISAGNYKPLTILGEKAQVQDVTGHEKGKSTTVKFSLPVKAASKYQRNLVSGSEYVMIIAYSQEDDFQHHSMMRTSIQVKL